MESNASHTRWRVVPMSLRAKPVPPLPQMSPGSRDQKDVGDNFQAIHLYVP